MTKSELCELVERVYASWNNQVPANQQKDVYNAWWLILKNLTKEACDEAITQLVIQDSYMPRPGSIYRQAIRIQHNWNPPTPLIAWEQLRTMAEAANTGTWHPDTQIHPEVKTVARKLGGTKAYTLHTNGDRDLFIQTYQQHLIEQEQQLTTQNPDPQHDQPPEPPQQATQKNPPHAEQSTHSE